MPPVCARTTIPAFSRAPGALLILRCLLKDCPLDRFFEFHLACLSLAQDVKEGHGLRAASLGSGRRRPEDLDEDQGDFPIREVRCPSAVILEEDRVEPHFLGGTQWHEPFRRAPSRLLAVHPPAKQTRPHGAHVARRDVRHWDHTALWQLLQQQPVEQFLDVCCAYLGKHTKRLSEEACARTGKRGVAIAFDAP